MLQNMNIVSGVDYSRMAKLFEREIEYEEVSKQRIAEGKYFPGFFTALYQKN